MSNTMMSRYWASVAESQPASAEQYDAGFYITTFDHYPYFENNVCLYLPKNSDPGIKCIAPPPPPTYTKHEAQSNRVIFN